MALLVKEILVDTIKKSVIKFSSPQDENFYTVGNLTGSISLLELTGANLGNINESPTIGISRISWNMPLSTASAESPWFAVAWGISGAASATGSTGSIYLTSNGSMDFSSFGCLHTNKQPGNYNGSIVLYNHSIIDAGAPVSIIIELLKTQGYGVRIGT